MSKGNKKNDKNAHYPYKWEMTQQGAQSKVTGSSMQFGMGTQDVYIYIYTYSSLPDTSSHVAEQKLVGTATWVNWQEVNHP